MREPGLTNRTPALARMTDCELQTVNSGRSPSEETFPGSVVPTCWRASSLHRAMSSPARPPRTSPLAQPQNPGPPVFASSLLEDQDTGTCHHFVSHPIVGFRVFALHSAKRSANTICSKSRPAGRAKHWAGFVRKSPRQLTSFAISGSTVEQLSVVFVCAVLRSRRVFCSSASATLSALLQQSPCVCQRFW